MDSNFNTVPNTGTFGNAVNTINTNFQLAKVAIDGIELSTTKSKGIFTSVSSLETSIPSPNIGDWAGVGASFPVKLYVCNTAGNWVDSGSTWSGGDINLSDYVTNSTFGNLVSATNDINIDALYPLQSGYYTLSTAIAAIPVGNFRNIGRIITFQSGSGVFERWQFIGTSVDSWADTSLWENIKDAVYENTRTQNENAAPSSKLLDDSYIELNNQDILMAKTLPTQDIKKITSVNHNTAGFYTNIRAELTNVFIHKVTIYTEPTTTNKVVIFQKTTDWDHVKITKIITLPKAESTGWESFILNVFTKENECIGVCSDKLYIKSSIEDTVVNFNVTINTISEGITVTKANESSYSAALYFSIPVDVLSNYSDLDTKAYIESVTAESEEILTDNIKLNFNLQNNSATGLYINTYYNNINEPFTVKKVKVLTDAGTINVVVLSSDYIVKQVIPITIVTNGYNEIDVNIRCEANDILGIVGKFYFTSGQSQFLNNTASNFDKTSGEQMYIGQQLTIANAMSMSTLFSYLYYPDSNKDLLPKESLEITAENILKLNNLYKKIYVADGDSITQGSGMTQHDGKTAAEAAQLVYAGLIASKNKMNYYNVAKGGTRIAKWLPFGRTIAYLNASGSVIGYDEIYRLSGTTTKLFTTPANCAKIRVTIANGLSGVDLISDLSSSLVVSLGSTLGTNLYSNSLNTNGSYINYDGNLNIQSGAIYAEIPVTSNAQYCLSNLYEFTDLGTNPYRYISGIERIDDVIAQHSNMEYYTMLYGANDSQFTPIGTIDSNSPYEFYGAFNLIINKLITLNPMIKIGIIGELNRGNAYTEAHNQCMVALSQKWCIPYFDSYSKIGVPKPTLYGEEKLYYDDGVHPNIKGNIKMANSIEQFMISL